MTVYSYSFSNDIRTPVKPVPPEAITDHGHRMAPGDFSLLRQKAPSDAGFYPQDLRVVGRNQSTPQPLRESICTQMEVEPAEGNHP